MISMHKIIFRYRDFLFGMLYLQIQSSKKNMSFIRKIIAIITIIISLFCIIAVLDYHPDDPSYFNSTDRAVSNITSKYGANIADLMFQAFGYAILIPLLLCIYLGGLEILRKKISMLPFKISIIFLTLPIFCFVIALLDHNTVMDGEYYHFNLGGYIGYFLKTEALYGKKMATITTVSIIGCGIVLLFISGGIEKLIIGINTKNPQDSTVNIKSQGRKLRLRQWIRKFLRGGNATLRKDTSTDDHKSTNDFFSSNPEIQFKKQQEVPQNTTDNKFFDIKNHHIESERKVDNYPILEPANKVKFDFNRAQESSNDKSLFPIISAERLEQKKILPISDLKPLPVNKQEHFILPQTQILANDSSPNLYKLTEEETEVTKNKLLTVLNDFGIKGTIIEVFHGPVVTLYSLEPVSGTKSSRVIGLADDIARSMQAKSARVAVVQGKNAIGIELPNEYRQIIRLKDLLESSEYKNSEHQLPLVLGKSITGEIIVVDLAKMPHLLVAGTTGSGKSVAIHSMILSLIYKYTPDDCKFIMIDPKMLEMSVYEGIPHLLSPVVTTPETAIATMQWVVKEMGTRYRAMSLLGVRNIISYNKLMREAQERNSNIEKHVQIGFNSETKQPIFESIVIQAEILPYIVVIIDEMADLMSVAGKDIEVSVQRLAQMARAAGIHLIMATQRPSVDVITGVIKANLPTRISFQVASKFDSRTILGEMGAEQLLGAGDMLYMMPGGKIERIHGAYVEDSDIENVVNHIKSQRDVQYLYTVADNIKNNE